MPLAHPPFRLHRAGGVLRLEMAVAQVVGQQLGKPGLVLHDQNVRHRAFLRLMPLRPSWQAHDDAQATERAVQRLDRAAMGLHDALADGQPQARAAGVPVA